MTAYDIHKYCFNLGRFLRETRALFVHKPLGIWVALQYADLYMAEIEPAAAVDLIDAHLLPPLPFTMNSVGVPISFAKDGDLVMISADLRMFCVYKASLFSGVYRKLYTECEMYCPYMVVCSPCGRWVLLKSLLGGYECKLTMLAFERVGTLSPVHSSKANSDDAPAVFGEITSLDVDFTSTGDSFVTWIEHTAVVRATESNAVLHIVRHTNFSPKFSTFGGNLVRGETGWIGITWEGICFIDETTYTKTPSANIYDSKLVQSVTSFTDDGLLFVHETGCRGELSMAYILGPAMTENRLAWIRACIGRSKPPAPKPQPKPKPWTAVPKPAFLKWVFQEE